MRPPCSRSRSGEPASPPAFGPTSPLPASPGQRPSPVTCPQGRANVMPCRCQVANKSLHPMGALLLLPHSPPRLTSPRQPRPGGSASLTTPRAHTAPRPGLAQPCSGELQYPGGSPAPRGAERVPPPVDARAREAGWAPGASARAGEWSLRPSLGRMGVAWRPSLRRRGGAGMPPVPSWPRSPAGSHRPGPARPRSASRGSPRPVGRSLPAAAGCRGRDDPARPPPRLPLSPCSGPGTGTGGAAGAGGPGGSVTHLQATQAPPGHSLPSRRRALRRAGAAAAVCLRRRHSDGRGRAAPARLPRAAARRERPRGGETEPGPRTRTISGTLHQPMEPLCFPTRPYRHLTRSFLHSTKSLHHPRKPQPCPTRSL